MDGELESRIRLIRSNDTGRDYFLLDAGGFLGDDPVSELMNYSVDIFAASLTDYHAMAVDGRMYYAGSEWMQKATDKGGLRLVLTNAEARPGVWLPKRYRILSSGGLTIGVLAVLFQPERPFFSDLSLSNPLHALNMMALKLKKSGVDYIIALVPEGGKKAEKVQKACHLVDMVICPVSGGGDGGMANPALSVGGADSVSHISLLYSRGRIIDHSRHGALSPRNNLEIEEKRVVQQELDAISQAMQHWRARYQHFEKMPLGRLVQTFSKSTLIRDIAERYGLKMLAGVSRIPDATIRGPVTVRELVSLWGEAPHVYVYQLEPQQYRALMNTQDAHFFSSRASVWPLRVGIVGEPLEGVPESGTVSIFASVADWVNRNAWILPSARSSKGGT